MKNIFLVIAVLFLSSINLFSASITREIASDVNTVAIESLRVTVDKNSVVVDAINNGNITYVPIGVSLDAYVTAATAGDTLILGSGTYTLYDTLVINKNLTIIGQGVDATLITLTSTTGTPSVIQAYEALMTSLTVNLSGFTITHTSTTGEHFYGLNAYQLGAARHNVNISNVDITLTSSTDGAATDQSATGIYYYGAQGDISNVRIKATASVRSAYGILVRQDAFAPSGLTVNINNAIVSLYTTGGDEAVAFKSSEDSTAVRMSFNVINSEGVVTGLATARNGLVADGANAVATGTLSRFSGGTADLRQANGGSVTIYGSVLDYGTESGTVTNSGVFRTQAVQSVYDERINAIGAQTGTANIDLSLGSYVTAEFTAGVTLNFTSTGYPSAGYVRPFTIYVSGNQTIAYPTGTVFTDSIAPTVSGNIYEIIGALNSSGVPTIYGIIQDIGN